MSTSCELAIAVGGVALGVFGGRIAAGTTTTTPEPTILRNNPEGMQIFFIDPSNPIYKAWNNLQTSGYEQTMREVGYLTYDPINTGLSPLTGTADREKGLNVRAYPTTNETISPVIATINAGELVSWYGEFPSLNPDDSMDIFGLRVNPGITNPTFIALRRIKPNGEIEWYVEMENPFIQRLADGSVDYDHGIIGPSTTDINP